MNCIVMKLNESLALRVPEVFRSRYKKAMNRLKDRQSGVVIVAINPPGQGKRKTKEYLCKLCKFAVFRFKIQRRCWVCLGCSVIRVLRQKNCASTLACNIMLRRTRRALSMILLSATFICILIVSFGRQH